MPIDYQRLKSWPIADQVTPYEERDCILYALGLGYGEDPLNAQELPFVFERGLRFMPSMLTVLGAPGAWATDPGTGINWMKILHGEHRLTIHALPAVRGSLRSHTKVARIVDKGTNRGVLVVTERVISDEATGQPIAKVEHTSFCRADGGIAQSDEAAAPLDAAPARAPDASTTLRTAASTALLYRLNGDRNPIHADPQAARAAGFERPILHGLCTYGMACRAILRMCCDQEPARLAGFSLRFSAPFFPGDSLRVDIWMEGNHVFFRGVSVETGKIVLSHGNAELRATCDLATSNVAHQEKECP